MSVQAITAALAVKGVSPSEKLVLIVLANYADDKWKCWPSQSTLASNTGLTDRSVRNVFASLAAKGLLSRSARHNAKGRTSDMLTLHLVPETISTTTESISGTPRKHVPQPPEMVSGEPTNEPSIERRRRARAAAKPRTPVVMTQEDRDLVARLNAYATSLEGLSK